MLMHRQFLLRSTAAAFAACLMLALTSLPGGSSGFHLKLRRRPSRVRDLPLFQEPQRSRPLPRSGFHPFDLDDAQQQAQQRQQPTQEQVYGQHLKDANRLAEHRRLLFLPRRRLIPSADHRVQQAMPAAPEPLSDQPIRPPGHEGLDAVRAKILSLKVVDSPDEGHQQHHNQDNSFNNHVVGFHDDDYVCNDVSCWKKTQEVEADDEGKASFIARLFPQRRPLFDDFDYNPAVRVSEVIQDPSAFLQDPSRKHVDWEKIKIVNPDTADVVHLLGGEDLLPLPDQLREPLIRGVVDAIVPATDLKPGEDGLFPTDLHLSMFLT